MSGSVGTDTSDDGVIEILIEAASRYLDRETGDIFYLGSADETRYYTPKGSNRKIRFDSLGSFTSISVDSTGSGDYSALQATDYNLMPPNAAAKGLPYTGAEIAVLSTSYFSTFRNSTKLVGKFGWPAVPKDIKEACLSIAQNLNGARSGQSSGGNVTITAAGIVIRPQDVPAFAQKVIEHYRIRN